MEPYSTSTPTHIRASNHNSPQPPMSPTHMGGFQPVGNPVQIEVPGYDVIVAEVGFAHVGRICPTSATITP